MATVISYIICMAGIAQQELKVIFLRENVHLLLLQWFLLIALKILKLQLKIQVALIPIVGYLLEQKIVGLVDLLQEWHRKKN